MLIPPVGVKSFPGESIVRAAITFIPETGRISPMYDVARHVIVCRLCRCATVPEAVVPAVDFPEDRASREKFLSSYK